MELKRVRLGDVVGYRARELSAGAWARIEAAGNVAAVGRSLAEAKVPQGWAGLRTKILEEADSLLDIGLLDVMRWAWNKSRELDRYRDREKYPSGETYRVPLIDHEIRSVHKPHLEVRLRGTAVGKVEFDLEIEIALQGMSLEIRDARIRKIRTGGCRVKGKFLCEGFLLAEQESGTLVLPGVVDLGEGIEI